MYQKNPTGLATIVAAVVCCGLCATLTRAEFVEIDPDNSNYFTQNGVVDGHGVTIRGWTETPPSPLSVWDQPYQRLYARSPLNNGVPYLGLQPSTGNLVFGIYGVANLHATTKISANVHMLFDSPTNFVGFDIPWPDPGWTEGVRFHAWARNSNGVETVVHSQVLDEGPMGTYTRVALFSPGITRVRLQPDDKYGFQSRSFSLDNISFIDASTASDLALRDGQTITAPTGLTVPAGDRLSGSGTVDGSVNVTGGAVAPGQSPGQINVTGDYEQDADSMLEMEIADGAHDQLLINGAAILAGTLELSLLDDFVPDDGEAFTLLSYESRQGTFDTITGLAFPGGHFEPTYEPDGLVVTAIVPEPAALALMAAGGLLIFNRRR